VLLDSIYKPMALQRNWLWAGSDFSEGTFVDEATLCRRLITDLSLYTSSLSMKSVDRKTGWFHASPPVSTVLTYDVLWQFFESQPGLMADKLKATLELAGAAIAATGRAGVVFAYDEAQVVQDRREKDQHSLALLLEAFQSMQRRGHRYLLVLTGLPTLYPKLVESRTYAERMFLVQEIGRLNTEECRDAITKPLEATTVKFTKKTVEQIIDASKCYPYFVQFLCREAFDYYKSAMARPSQQKRPALPINTLIRKLDADFFAGRWGNITDRQRELLLCVAHVEMPSDEFTVQQVAATSKSLAITQGFRPFRTTDISQFLPRFIDLGLVYRNRHGQYCLAIPLFAEYVRRRFAG
jgi:hypothetical protein